MAVSFSGGEAVTDDELKAIRKTLDFNYRMTKQQHPDWGLPEDWELVSGHRTQQYEYEVCRECKGDGEWDLYNEDGTFSEHWVCPGCGGVGSVSTGIPIPGRYMYQFGWYVTVP